MMRIFVPYGIIALNVTCLDPADLTVQRNNAMTILDTIGGTARGWQWHPGVTMWIPYDDLLAAIAHAINVEWAEAYAEHDVGSLRVEYDKKLKLMGYSLLASSATKLPWWWKNKQLHASNRAAMLRHNPDWYKQVFEGEDSSICDWWPRIDNDSWVYGPQPSPDGKFDYLLEGKPIFESADEMSREDFAKHANGFHNLMPDIKAPIEPNTPAMEVIIAVHNRFHQKRVYDTHDHR